MAQAPQVTLDSVDLTDPDAFVDGIPHEWFRLLRDQAPVHFTPEPAGRGFWSITRYADLVSASKDWRTYSSELGGTSLQDLTPEQVEARKSMLDMDPPAHTRLRAIVNKGFTPRIINTYEERIRDLSRRVLADAFARGELDFVQEVSMEIPMRVFAELLGAPAEDRRLLIAIGDRMLGNTDPEQVRDDPVYGREDVSEYAHLPFSSPAALEMFAYGHRLAEQRRAEPRDDIVTTPDRGRGRWLAADRARVRRDVPAAHGGRQRDDPALAVDRPARAARAPGAGAAAARRPVALRHGRRRDPALGDARSCTSAGRPPATPSCTACGSPRATRCCSGTPARTSTSASSPTR